MRYSCGYWPLMGHVLKGKTNWHAGGGPLQILNFVWISSESWQLPGEERTTVGSGEPFQIPKSLWRSSYSSNRSTDFL